MESTVEALCKALARSRLLSPDAVRGLYQRWIREAKESAPDVSRFGRWLVANQVVSEYQLGVLSRGHGDQLFLNQYKIIERVGRGRMAGVFKAVHNLGHTVAIKVLPPSKARDPMTFARFQREARLALRLRHPNVVRTYHTDEAKGLHYLVMEYLEGETLAEVLQRRGRLSVPETVRVGRQALLGLQHLHENKLVHRDITPGNFMLLGGDSESSLHAKLKILDIGTGRELFEEGEPSGKQFALTNEGDVLGSPLYMAPEQASNPHAADIRADLYGLGCVLYHALAGRPPFDDKSNVRLLVRHAKETPLPLAEVCPDAAPALQGFFDRLLAKDPARRYPDPQTALDALNACTEATADEVAAEGPELRAYLEWVEEQTVDVKKSGAPAAEPAPRRPRSDTCEIAGGTAGPGDWPEAGVTATGGPAIDRGGSRTH